MNKPKVSIVCVTRNAADCIGRCVNSILSQTYSNIELVIQDGNSTDGTQDILRSYGDKIAYWKSEPDTGIYNAMNKALDKATGEWVYFVGADDALLPDFSLFVDKELEEKSAIYYANVIYKGVKTKGEVKPYEQAKHGIFHQTIVYPMQVFRKYRYDERYKVVADYALNLKLHGDKEFRFVYRDYTIAMYNDSGISSYSEDEVFRKDHLQLVLHNFEWGVKLRFLFKTLKAKIKGGTK